MKEHLSIYKGLERIMKNKKTIIILAILIVLITGIFLVNNIYQNKAEVSKTKRKKLNNLAIMIKNMVLQIILNLVQRTYLKVIMY